MNVDAVSVSQVMGAAPRKAGGVPSAAAAPRAREDSVELSGRATGHARVAQNIEKRVERMIAREVGGAAGREAGAALEETLRGIASANVANPSNPSGVLRAIREAVEQARTAAPVTPTEPTEPGEPVEPVEPVEPAGPVETDLAAPGELATPSADLSALRLAAAYAPVEGGSRFEWTV